MDHEVKIGELTTCGVSDEGHSVELRANDVSGAPVLVTMSFEQAQGVMMTLPRLLTRALQTQTGNPNHRFVFPLGHWSVERSENANCLITTLRTDDGFGVSFAIPVNAARSLGDALVQDATSRDKTEPSREGLTNLESHLH